MRIVIDYQGAQSGGSRHRGIGRYTSAITRALIRQAPDAEIILLLNGAFVDTIEPIRAEFAKLLPQENILIWRPLRPIAHIQAENDDRRRASEQLREIFIARLNPDALLITSHFEGSGDNGATTVGLLPANYPTAIILYDLIPYIYRSIYLSNPAVERWYEERVGNLKQADLLLAISASSRQEAIDYLGFPAHRGVNISTAADPHFKKIKLSEVERQALFARYGITKPFVMYTGGIDHRKNIEGLIRAFANLPKAIRRQHQLAIICSMRAEDGPRLRQTGRDVGLAERDFLLTGFVPETDLVALYNSCKLFVFPSWHEGFGLPALEAMWCGAPVIAANSSSLPEVIGDPAALFDAGLDDAITEKMAIALTDEQFRQRLIENGSRRLAMFSWDMIAKRALEAIKGAIAPIAAEARPGRTNHRPRLAMVSPAPPAESGIAYYAATLIRALQGFYQVDLVVRAGLMTDDPFILANCKVIDDVEFRRQYENYDRVVYQFGNSDHHDHMCDLIKDCPGVVVLHDYFVGDLSSWREHLGGVPGNWGIDLYESHGIGALLERHAEPDLFAIINKYPCSYAVTRYALGVLCHSQEARDLQVYWHGREAARDWTVIPMIRATPKLPSRLDARNALGIGVDEFIVCAFGILGRSKLNHRLIEAWGASQLAQSKKCRLMFIGGYGSQDYYTELRALADDSDVVSKIEFTGWVDESDYWNYLAAADVAAQLRGITHGETSAATLDAMLAGLPVIANASPSLPEGADDTIALIPPEASAPDLTTAIERMFGDSEQRQQLSRSARDFAVRKHSESVCGLKFTQAIEQSYCRSMRTFTAGLQQVSRLELSESEATSLAVEYAGLLNLQRTLYLDVTGLVPGLPQDFQAFLRPLLLTLAVRAPNLRVVAIYRVAERYISAIDPVMRAALVPHPDQSAEEILIKGVDIVVSIHDEDADFARRMVQTAGARHLRLGKRSPSVSQVADKMLKFAGYEIGTAGKSIAKGAKQRPASASDRLESVTPSRKRRGRVKPRGKPVPVKGRKR